MKTYIAIRRELRKQLALMESDLKSGMVKGKAKHAMYISCRKLEATIKILVLVDRINKAKKYLASKV